jgi:hypothetical protein
MLCFVWSKGCSERAAFLFSNIGKGTPLFRVKISNHATGMCIGDISKVNFLAEIPEYILKQSCIYTWNPALLDLFLQHSFKNDPATVPNIPAFPISISY